MIARRAVIALLAIACAIDAGCRTSGIAQMSPKPSRGSRLTGSSSRASGVTSQRSPSPSRSRRSYRPITWSPHRSILNRMARLVPPMRLAFAGDDRGFDVDAPSYRARQIVTVIPDEAEDADGLLEGSKCNIGGITESFDAVLALADGRIDDADRTGVPEAGGSSAARSPSVPTG